MDIKFVKQSVKLKVKSKPLDDITIEEFIVELARVSSGRNQEDIHKDALKLIKYLIKHSHWSPFEHAFLTYEIVTTRAISAQLLRHRSNYFQEFSQRYAPVNVFVFPEMRLKGSTNRQGSLDETNPNLSKEQVVQMLQSAVDHYNSLLNDYNIAPECARMVLPMCSATKVYITMNIRSLIHFLQIRFNPLAQKEMQEIAKMMMELAKPVYPQIFKTLGY